MQSKHLASIQKLKETSQISKHFVPNGKAKLKGDSVYNAQMPNYTIHVLNFKMGQMTNIVAVTQTKSTQSILEQTNTNTSFVKKKNENKMYNRKINTNWHEIRKL